MVNHAGLWRAAGRRNTVVSGHPDVCDLSRGFGSPLSRPSKRATVPSGCDGAAAPAGARCEGEGRCAFASGARGARSRSPGPTTVRYGGNTSCVEVRTDAGTLIVLDCGTGAHEPRPGAARGAGGPRARPPPHRPHALGPHPGPALLRAAVRRRQRVGHLRPARPRPSIDETLAGPDAVHVLPGHARGVRRHDRATTTSVEGQFEIDDVTSPRAT